MIDFKNLVDGKLVNLIEINKNFISDMHDYSIDQRLYEHLEFEKHKTIKDTEIYFDKLLKRHQQINAHYYFIQNKLNLKVIGSIGVHDIDLRKMSCEISYGLSPTYWGKGIFIDTLEILLKDLFTIKNFNRVQAITSVKNLSSIKSLEKFNFKKEGVLRDFYRSSKFSYFDAQILALLKKDYIAKEN
tara:strand:- start:107 stop:667 length:561 start_codon:yes stop_codon:yes gene_type:complete